MVLQNTIEIIEKQIGRSPRGLEEVVVETATGIPLVLRIRSLVDDQPFPTLYWLCSKDLHQAIARLETEGWVGRLEQQLQDDKAMMADYQQNHREYVARRWQLIRDEDKARIEALGFTDLFHKYGIGGIVKWDKVRCLHMHYAHYLAAGADTIPNVIGQFLEGSFKLSELDCQI